jgi:FemAB-related protein (PEP-CTERM system-associated)
MDVLASGPVAPLVVRALDDASGERWDAFVTQHPASTFFHLSSWREVLDRVLGHRTMYLYAERNGHIEAVLPLARVRSWLFGDALISLPFAVYGGILSNSDDAKAALEREAIRVADEARVEYLEMRNLAPAQDWPTKDLYATFRKAISASDEENMLAIPRKQRAMVRKGIQAGLKGVVDDSVDRFYDIYSTSVRNLGTPVLSKRYFGSLKRIFGAACDVLTIEHQGQAVASVLSFYFKDEVLPFYGGGLAAARAVDANDFMYWDLMCKSARRGIRRFDFGRSKQGTGPFRFKTHWGFEPQPLAYQYHLVRRTEMPDLSPMNPSYQKAIALWRRLPVSVSRVLGPPIARNLG